MDMLLLYLIVVNLITFFNFILDKKKSREEMWRIPESQLLFLSLIGGSLGGIIAMILVRHKTKKTKFIIGMPILLLLNIYVFYTIFVKRI